MVIDNFQHARHSLVFFVYYMVHPGWTHQKFQNRSSQMDGKRYFEVDFCK